MSDGEYVVVFVCFDGFEELVFGVAEVYFDPWGEKRRVMWGM